MTNRQKNHLTTYIFDFDGTIADTLLFMVTSFNEIAPDYNLPIILSEHLEDVRNLSAKELLKKYPVSPLNFIKISRTIRQKLKKNMSTIQSIKGISQLFVELKKRGCIVGILTTNSKENVQLFLRQNDIKTVDFIHSEKNLFGKAKVLSRILGDNNFSKNSVVYIGDEVRDVEAAEKAGIASIAVTWGFNSEKRLVLSKPTYLVGHPHEILEIKF